LRKSSLFQLLGLIEEEHSAAALRQALADAIEAQKPDRSVPPDSSAWRDYQTLSYRYVERLAQPEIAADLGVSTRQLRRLERRALATLAEYLWQHHKVASRLRAEMHAGSRPERENAPSRWIMTPSRQQELDWLRDSEPVQTVDLEKMIHPTLKMARQLMAASGVQIEIGEFDALSELSIHLSATQQALINVLTVAAQRVPHGRIQMEVAVFGHEIHLHVRAYDGVGKSEGIADEDQERLEMAQELLKLSGGSLEIGAADDGTSTFSARIALPTVEQISVLAVDDNPDTLYLLERYVAGTRYRITGTREPQQVVALARQLAPQIIVLDVMLPEIDGWELLERLRAYPDLRNTPIIVCTILPQEPFALVAGATDFVRKPVSREVFLAALDRQHLTG